MKNQKETLGSTEYPKKIKGLRAKEKTFVVADNMDDSTKDALMKLKEKMRK